jgi:hypothetical protein
VFSIEMAQRDHDLIVRLRDFLGVGKVSRRNARKDWLPTSSYAITSEKVHFERTIPSADRFLLASAKRDQFEAWRAALLAYRAVRPPRQRSICSVERCDRFVRGRGLCRSHYYQATGW